MSPPVLFRGYPEAGKIARSPHAGTLVIMRLAVRGVPKGALRTHSAWQTPLWGSLVTCVVYCLRVRQC